MSMSSDPFYAVTYYIKWVTTSWTYSNSSCKILTLNKNDKYNMSMNYLVLSAYRGFFFTLVDSRPLPSPAPFPIYICGYNFSLLVVGFLEKEKKLS